MKNRNIVAQWLKFAEVDMASAVYLQGMWPKPLEIICYHCQQSAEKALKGFLISQGLAPKRTHDLSILLNECMRINADFEKIVYECARLTMYGVQPRYPFEMEIEEEDMKVAIKDSKTVNELVTLILKEEG